MEYDVSKMLVKEFKIALSGLSDSEFAQARILYPSLGNIDVQTTEIIMAGIKPYEKALDAEKTKRKQV